MDAAQYGALDFADVDTADLAEPFWRDIRALLSYKLDPHQLETDALFNEWNERRGTIEYEEEVVAAGAELDDVWVEEIGRRFGKTAKWIIKLTVIALLRPGAVLLYGTAYQKDITEIIVPLANLLLADGPDDMRPVYQSSKKGQNEGLYFPNGSVIKLGGLDTHPEAFRGRFSDGIVLSEAGFMKGLKNLLQSVLLPQFQRRPWAFCVLESSTSKELDHDFLQYCVPDAKLRGAYIMRTLDDNLVITEREKAKAIRQAGGRGSTNCEREYYCVQTRDPVGVVIPEFDAKVHVREMDKPAYYVAMTAADPGMQDLFGQVWGYWDFDAACAVVNASWCARNASTRRVAAVNAMFEWRLYGAQCPKTFEAVPLKTEGRVIGWEELLRGEKWSGDARRLAAQARLKDRLPAEWSINHPSTQSVFWDGVKFVQNPYRRVSDIEKRLMADLDAEFGYLFFPTAKDDAEAQVNVVRNAIATGKLVFTPDAGPVIDHVNYARWNERRTDWERHAVHGHYDCIYAESLVKTARGDVAIRDVVVGDMAWTRRGLRRVTAAWLVGERPIWRLETTSGILEATADHRIWTDSGWKHLAELTRSDILCGWESSDQGSLFGSTVTPTDDIQRPRLGPTGSITRAGHGSRFITCIMRFGASIMASFRRALTSIIATATRSTTTSPISSYSLAPSTGRGTSGLRSGPSAQRHGSETALSAASGSPQSWREPLSADATVMQRSGDTRESTTSTRLASCVEALSEKVATHESSLVPVAVVGVTFTGRYEKVYDLTVEGEHEFFANGILVHNCLAALVYFMRNIQIVRAMRPFPPKYTDPRQADLATWFKPAAPAPEELRSLAEGFSGVRRFGQWED